MVKKAILLCGGTGQMFHSTLATNKHLMPVYDKPMFLPLSVLMLSIIKDFLIVTNPGQKKYYEWTIKRYWN